MKKVSLFKLLFLLLTAALIVACGGGKATDNTNEQPQATAAGGGAESGGEETTPTEAPAENTEPGVLRLRLVPRQEQPEGREVFGFTGVIN